MYHLLSFPCSHNMLTIKWAISEKKTLGLGTWNFRGLGKWKYVEFHILSLPLGNDLGALNNKSELLLIRPLRSVRPG